MAEAIQGGVQNTATTFNKKLLLTISVVSAAVFIKLANVANATDNWRGFCWSALHVSLVALCSYLALRQKIKTSQIEQASSQR